MKNIEWDQVFHEYATLVKNKLQSDELSSPFLDYVQFRDEHIRELSDWQLALPVVACLASSGSVEDGNVLASAWSSLYLASEIFDHVEDQEFIPDRVLLSPEVASNLATGLIFAAFHTLTFIHDSSKSLQIQRIFAGSGFDAVQGQHRSLTQADLPMDAFLNHYWEVIILKSGSVFRAALEGAAAAGGADQTVTEALADYGTALGVICQLIDDCRDAFSTSQEAIHWEVTLPLLLF